MIEGCCEDVHISLSIEDDQIQNSVLSVSPNWELALIEFPAFDADEESELQFRKPYLIHPPPKKSNSRIYIQSLVLYA